MWWCSLPNVYSISTHFSGEIIEGTRANSQYAWNYSNFLNNAKTRDLEGCSFSNVTAFPPVFCKNSGRKSNKVTVPLKLQQFLKLCKNTQFRLGMRFFGTHTISIELLLHSSFFVCFFGKTGGNGVNVRKTTFPVEIAFFRTIPEISIISTVLQLDLSSFDCFFRKKGGNDVNVQKIASKRVDIVWTLEKWHSQSKRRFYRIIPKIAVISSVLLLYSCFFDYFSRKAGTNAVNVRKMAFHANLRFFHYSRYFCNFNDTETWFQFLPKIGWNCCKR